MIPDSKKNVEPEKDKFELKEGKKQAVHYVDRTCPLLGLFRKIVTRRAPIKIFSKQTKETDDKGSKCLPYDLFAAATYGTCIRDDFVQGLDKNVKSQYLLPVFGLRCRSMPCSNDFVFIWR
jgi:hypothetical protein